MSALSFAPLPADTSAPSPMPVAVRECLAAKRAALVVTAGPKVWDDMDKEVRTILVVLTGAAGEGDPEAYAMRPWGHFTPEQRSQISHLARRMFKNLAGALYL